MKTNGKETHKVKVGSVSIPVFYNEPGGWRFGWKEGGKWKYKSRKDLAEAKRLALEKAKELAGVRSPLGAVRGEKAELLRKIMAMCPTDEDLLAFANFMVNRATKRVTVGEAAKAFLDFKTKESGATRNVETLRWGLRKLMAEFDGRMLDELLAHDLDALLQKQKNPRTRLNLRRGLVTFFRWCRTRGHLDDAKLTEMEKTQSARARKKTPSTYSPVELKAMLDNVADDFRPWLVVGAFLGVRSAEILRMDWSMFKWDQGHLELPPEITKTGERRVIPIPPAVALWLPDPPSSGRVCEKPPHQINRGKKSETAKLGALVGGWKKNGLRHSWASYRCAIAGFKETAMEAGNSETMIRSTYRDAKTKGEAEEWFGLRPLNVKFGQRAVYTPPTVNPIGN